MLPEIIKTSELWGPLFALTIFLLMLMSAITTQIIFHILIFRNKYIKI